MPTPLQALSSLIGKEVNSTEGAWPERKGRFLQNLKIAAGFKYGLSDRGVFVKRKICLSKFTPATQVGFTLTINVWDAGINCCGFDLYLGSNTKNSPSAN